MKLSIASILLFIPCFLIAQNVKPEILDVCEECYIEYKKGMIDSTNKSYYKFKACSFRFDSTNNKTLSNICFYLEYKNGTPHGREFMSYMDTEQEATAITIGKGEKARTKSYITMGYKYHGTWKNGKKHGYWFTFDKKGVILSKEKWKKGIKKTDYNNS